MHPTQTASVGLHTGKRLQKWRKSSNESEQQQEIGDAGLHAIDRA